MDVSIEPNSFFDAVNGLRGALPGSAVVNVSITHAGLDGAANDLFRELQRLGETRGEQHHRVADEFIVIGASAVAADRSLPWSLADGGGMGGAV